MTRKCSLNRIYLVCAFLPLCYHLSCLRSGAECRELAWPSTEARAETQTEGEISQLQQRAILIIRDQVELARRFEDPRSSVRIGLKAGHLLWPFDPTSARNYLDQAYQLTVERFRASLDNSERDGKAQAAGWAALRLQVIRVIALHDPLWSEEILRKVAQEAEHSTSSPGWEPGEGFLDLAQNLVEGAPQVAVAAATQSLKFGVTRDFAQFLYTLAANDQPAADRLYADAIAQLTKMMPSQALSDLLLLSAYPFGDQRLLVSDGLREQRIGFLVPEKFQSRSRLTTEFLDVAFTVLTRASDAAITLNNQQAPTPAAVLFAIESLLRRFQASRPDQAASLSNSLAALRARVSGEVEHAIAQRVGTGNPPLSTEEDLLNAADLSANGVERASLLWRAAYLSAVRGDLEKTRGILTRISQSEETAKGQMLTLASLKAAERATALGQYEAAKDLALKIPELDLRAYLLASVASAAFSSEDRVRAIELLDDAERVAVKADDSPAKVRALVAVSALYQKIDADRGFNVVSEALKSISRLKRPYADDPNLVREVEAKDFRANYTAPTLAFSLDRTLGQLASSDFDRALLLAESMEDKPLRASLVISVAGSVLSKRG